ncbi:hypothetical protein SBA4_6900002 [Candidatus Sulfopaludibacter sp. SbA4]|nr:hypothetical protein SBA4_6900002 [Candidatus Sulfopaludibacter sp. SbA4]
MKPENLESLSLGKWIGRGQAFAVSASHSLISQAKCWKGIRDSGSYKASGLTWDQFCTQEIGLSRQYVEELIDNLEKYGETFCQLLQIVKISADVYRAISPKIDGEAIEIDGEMVPIAPENAGRIRAAVLQMRSDLRQANEKPAKDPVTAVQTRIKGCVAAISRLSEGNLEGAGRDALRAIVEDSVLRLMEISERLAA